MHRHPGSATQRLALAHTYRAVGREPAAAHAIRAAYALDPFDDEVLTAYRALPADGAP